MEILEISLVLFLFIKHPKEAVSGRFYRLLRIFVEIDKFDKMHKKLSCFKSETREDLNCKKFSENNSVEK